MSVNSLTHHTLHTHHGMSSIATPAQSLEALSNAWTWPWTAGLRWVH